MSFFLVGLCCLRGLVCPVWATVSFLAPVRLRPYTVFSLPIIASELFITAPPTSCLWLL